MGGSVCLFDGLAGWTGGGGVSHSAEGGFGGGEGRWVAGCPVLVGSRSSAGWTVG